MASKTTRPFGLRDKIGYAFGDMANDFTFMLSSIFMLKFYTDIMGIDAAVVGLLMMLARFIDAITDVAMGQIVDRSKPTKHGKFKPWIMRMAGPVAIASFLIYQSEFAGMDYTFKVVWMFVTYLLWGSIFYTSVNIPYGSMASAVSPDSNHRVQLSSWRTIGATTASIVIGVVTSLFAYVTAANGSTVLSGQRMLIIAGVFSICAFICYFVCFKLVTERVKVPQNTEKLNIPKLLKSIVTNRSLIGIIAAAILLLISSLGIQGMAAYVFPVYYGSAEGQSMFNLFGQIGTIILIAPLAIPITKAIGKKEFTVIGCALAAATYLICWFVKPQDVMVFMVFCSIGYLCVSCFHTTCWALITDVIDDAEVKNGIREDGTIYSVYSFARKLGQAFSSGLIGGVLSAIGYSAAVANEPWAYPQVTEQIFNISCLLPVFSLVAVCLALVFIYPLNKKRVEKNQAILKERSADCN